MFADDLETAEKRLGRAVLGFCKKFSPFPPALDLTQFLWQRVRRQLGKVDTDFK